MIKMRKYSFQDVVNAFAKTDYKLLSTEDEYVNSGTNNMRYICPRHEDKGELTISLAHLREGKGCKYCGEEKCHITRQIEFDKEADKKLCESHGFSYIDTYRKKGKITIRFICNQHKELGEQEMVRSNMQRDIKGCKYCYNRDLPKWYVEKKIKEVNPYIIPLEEYDKLSDRINCMCTIHNYVHRKSIQEILMGKGCKYCGFEKLSNKFTKDLQQAQADVNKYNPHVTLLEYAGTRDNCRCHCNTHNQDFVINFGSLMRRKSGCSQCYKELIQSSQGIGTDAFADRLKTVHPELEFYGEYTNNATKMHFHCKEHNYDFYATPANILERRICCPKANTTHKEEIMCQLLEKWGLTVERQKIFIDCVDQRPLPFDAYLPDYNAVIEYQGEQHYKAVKYGTHSIAEGQRKHNYCKKHDEIKKTFCDNNNITYIDIPYWMFNDLENFLFSKLVDNHIIQEINIS